MALNQTSSPLWGCCDHYLERRDGNERHLLRIAQSWSLSPTMNVAVLAYRGSEGLAAACSRQV